MIQFNELKITKDGLNLIIDVSIEKGDYYEDVFLDSIYIDTEETFTSSGPSDNCIYHKEIKDENTLKSANLNPIVSTLSSNYYTGIKSYRLILNKQTLGADLKNHVFFVHVTAKGLPKPNTPCGQDKSLVTGTVLYLYPIFKKSLCYMEVLNKCCEVPTDFIHYILQVKSLEYSIKNSNQDLVIKHWKNLTGNKSLKITQNCNCNG